jgi:hypothetical protein
MHAPYEQITSTFFSHLSPLSPPFPLPDSHARSYICKPSITLYSIQVLQGLSAGQSSPVKAHQVKHGGQQCRRRGRASRAEQQPGYLCGERTGLIARVISLTVTREARPHSPPNAHARTPRKSCPSQPAASAQPTPRPSASPPRRFSSGRPPARRGGSGTRRRRRMRRPPPCAAALLQAPILMTEVVLDQQRWLHSHRS